MKFESAVQQADKLAYKNCVGRVTLNIVEHPKTGKIHIVEELSRFDKHGREIKQRFQSHVDMAGGKVNVDAEVDYLKTKATFRFLGEAIPAIEDLGKYCVVTGRVVPEAVAKEVVKSANLDTEEAKEEEKPEEPVKEEAPEEPVKEAAQAAPQAAEASAEEAADSQDEPKVAEAKGSKAAEEPKKETKTKAKSTKAKATTKKKTTRKKNIKFDRNVQLHLTAVSTIIKGELGDGWRDEKANTSAVADLVFNHLDGKRDLYGPESGEVLEDFTQFVKQFLREKLNLSDSEEDETLAKM